MSRAAKAVVGIATIAPVFGCVWILWRLLQRFAEIAGGGNTASPGVFSEMLREFAAVGTAILVLDILLLVFYLTQVMRNPRLDSTMRLLWGVGIFLLGFFAMAVYFFLHLAPDDAMQAQADRIRARRGAIVP